MDTQRLALAHRLWRKLPVAARRGLLARLAGWAAPRADAAPPARSAGVVVAGEMAAPTGMGEAARLLAAGCAALGLARGTASLSVGGRAGQILPADAALLLVVNAPSIPLMLARAPRGFLRGRRVIGAWAWELPVVPASWAVAPRYVHEIWACSHFTAAALEPLLPGRVRVVPYPLALAAPLAPAGTRAEFGLPDGAVVTTVIFSLGSSFERKNPLAAMAAFKAAFGARDDHLLVMKMAGETAFPAEAAQVAAAAKGAGNIRILTGHWPPARVEGLLAVSDIVLSLHRAEGFGLVPARAMLRGIPVVATGWSGNLQFMDSHSAALVGYRLIPVADPSGVYGKIPGAIWAEPNIEDAAVRLRRLGDDAAARAALGQRGRDYAFRALNGEAVRAALAANGIG